MLLPCPDSTCPGTFPWPDPKADDFGRNTMTVAFMPPPAHAAAKCPRCGRAVEGMVMNAIEPDRRSTVTIPHLRLVPKR